jgi:hypothetical protein
MDMERAGEQRSLGELFSELARETGTLVRQEARLATAEMKTKAKTAAQDGVVVGIGGGVAALGGLGIFAALILLAAKVMALWAAALLVGGIFLAVGGAVIWLGIRAFRDVDAVPRMTVKTLEDNKRWLREQVAQ